MTFDLEKALRRWPLPDGIEDRSLNMGQCAKALDVSVPMITRYLDHGLPVLERGSNGQAYKFQASEVWAWKQTRDADQAAEKAAADRAAAQMALEFRNPDDDDRDPDRPVMSAKEIMEESKADYEWNKARELRGDLVRADKVRRLFETVLAEARTQFVSLVDFAEMEFGLTPDQVRTLQTRVDGTLLQMRRELGTAAPGEVQHLPDHRPLVADDDRDGARG